jgi:flagellin
MGIRINTNVEALNAQRNLGTTAVAFGKSVEKLSSGLRINRAADDAAGLAISEKLRAQVRGTNQAMRNAQDGISLIQTAEGALNEVHSMFQRARELALQAANGTLASGDISSVSAEINALFTEVDRSLSTAKFNGKDLFGATAAAVALQVGSDANQTVSVTLATTTVTTLGVTQTSVGSAANAQTLIGQLDSAIAAVSTKRGSFGAVQNTLEHTIANLSVAAENLAASESRIRDLDVAAEMVSFTKSQILQQAGTAILAQANQAPQSVLSLLR